MKLNRRAGLLILPVLALGYLLAFVGVYYSQKQNLIEYERLSVELQIADLADTFSRYASLARNYLYTFIGSQSFRSLLASEDPRYRVLAVGGSLDDAIANLGIHSSNSLSVAVFDGAGELEYYYADSLDPFSGPDTHQLKIVDGMLRQGLSQMSTFSGSELPVVFEARLVDRYTLQPPLQLPSEDAVAVVIGIQVDTIKRQLARLAAGDRQVEWVTGPGQPHPAGAALIGAVKEIEPYGMIRVSVPPEQIARKLADIKYVLAAAFLLITTLSWVTLSWLLRRYITQPIRRLERDLVGISYEGEEQLRVEHGDDEIGRLSRTFAALYEDLRKSYQIARDMAERDGLTRLYNRRMFNHLIERILARAEAGGGRVALLYIDVDNFKHVNDKYGHGVGDELLRTFSDRLVEALRPSDVVCIEAAENCSARLAGDEFAVILHSYESDDVPRRIAERVLAIGTADDLALSARVSVSLSIGVACFPRDARSSSKLISCADTAMYQAKHQGKNRFSFYSRELAEQARRAVDIETRLKRLNYGELELHYMPIVEAATGRVAGFEALIRWNCAALGRVPPEEFIPIAESMGVYREIDRWVITHASDDLPRLQAHFGPKVRVAVNISSAELESREFVDEVAIMVEHGFIRPEHMDLEITETFHINHRTDSEAILADLRRLGFSISIDDFGTGYTSLVQLVEYEIDKLKLDKSFVAKVLERERVEVIASLVTFCKSQDFAVIAEGVETAEQASLLSAAGCDYLQGFHFREPASLESLLAGPSTLDGLWRPGAKRAADAVRPLPAARRA